MSNRHKKQNQKSTGQRKVNKIAQMEKALLGAALSRRQRRPRQRAGPMRAGPNSMGTRRNRGGPLGLSSNPGNGSTSRYQQIIVEDEYIADVNGSATFATTGYSINPGNATMFPWGSRIAQLYDEYEFVSLEFYYQRIASEFNTSASTGEIILSIDYNATDPVPQSLAQVLATREKNKGMPCDKSIPLRADCKLIKTQPSKFVLVGAQPANTDAKTFNAGVLYVSVQGTGTANTLGRLFVRYKCKLKEPVLEPSAVGGVLHFSSITPTTANNFAGAVLQPGYSPTLGGINLSVANTITIPAGLAGNYMVTVLLSAATSVTAISASGYTGGASGLKLLTSAATVDNTSAESSNASTTTAPAFYVSTFSVTGAGGAVVLNASTIVTSGTASLDVFVVSLPTTVLTALSPLEKRLQELEERFSRSFRIEPVYSEDEDFKESPLPQVSESGAVKIPPSEGFFGAPDLSASYLARVGDALGVRRSGSDKK